MSESGKVGKKLKEQLLILKELSKAPRAMGTLCASSPFLARAMATPVKSIPPHGQIIELGAGTGPVTRALLAHGIPKERLTVVEISPTLVDCLRQRFPDVRILCCGAECLKEHLDLSVPVQAIVSSLPFRSLPTELTAAIMQQIESLLAPGGLYIQFTYAILGEIPMVPKSFTRMQSTLVLRNLPPAKVEVYQNTVNGARCFEDENTSH